MSDKPVFRTFEAPNNMRRKARPNGGPTLEEMEQGEATTIKRLKLGHGRELNQEVDGLAELARQILRDPASAPDKINSILIRAQSVRVLAATFGQPLLSEVAGSLCEMIDGHEVTGDKMQQLIQLHVDTIRLVINQKMTDAEAPEWQQMFKMLESAVRKATAV